MCVCLYVCVCVSVSVYLSLSVSVSVSVSMYVYVYVYVFMRTCVRSANNMQSGEVPQPGSPQDIALQLRSDIKAYAHYATLHATLHCCVCPITAVCVCPRNPCPLQLLRQPAQPRPG